MSMVGHVRLLRCVPVLAMTLMAGSLNAKQAKSEDTAYSLFHACQNAISFVDTPNASQPGRADYCFGYFEGYSNVVSLNGSQLCLGNARIGTLIRVYIAYMEKNPKELDDPNVFGVTHALRESYSCPTDTSTPPK